MGKANFRLIEILYLKWSPRWLQLPEIRVLQPLEPAYRVICAFWFVVKRAQHVGHRQPAHFSETSWPTPHFLGREACLPLQHPPRWHNWFLGLRQCMAPLTGAGFLLFPARISGHGLIEGTHRCNHETMSAVFVERSIGLLRGLDAWSGSNCKSRSPRRWIAIFPTLNRAVQ